MTEGNDQSSETAADQAAREEAQASVTNEPPEAHSSISDAPTDATDRDVNRRRTDSTERKTSARGEERPATPPAARTQDSVPAARTRSAPQPDASAPAPTDGTDSTDRPAPRRPAQRSATTAAPARTSNRNVRSSSPARSPATQDQAPAPRRARRAPAATSAAPAPPSQTVPAMSQPPGAATPEIVSDEAPKAATPPTRERPAKPIELTAAHADAVIRFTSMLLQQGLFADANTVLEKVSPLMPDNELLIALLAVSRVAIGQNDTVLAVCADKADRGQGELNGFWPLIENMASVAGGDYSRTNMTAERFIAASSLQNNQRLSRNDPGGGPIPALEDH